MCFKLAKQTNWSVIPLLHQDKEYSLFLWIQVPCIICHEDVALENSLSMSLLNEKETLKLLYQIAACLIGKVKEGSLLLRVQPNSMSVSGLLKSGRFPWKKTRHCIFHKPGLADSNPFEFETSDLSNYMTKATEWFIFIWFIFNERITIRLVMTHQLEKILPILKVVSLLQHIKATSTFR